MKDQSSYKGLLVVAAKGEPRFFNSCRLVWLYVPKAVHSFLFLL